MSHGCSVKRYVCVYACTVFWRVLFMSSNEGTRALRRED